MKKTVGIVGARGHTGAELIQLLAGHPGFELAAVSSRELDGQRVADHVPQYAGGLCYRSLAHEELGSLGLDAWVLALPNGKSDACLASLATVDAPGVSGAAGAADASNRTLPFDPDGGPASASRAPVIVDLSADHRFDDAWYYGLPELTRDGYSGQRLIANPGCYASAMQLAVAPMLDLLAGPVQCFGVSGYSGAGTTPSDRNDVAKLHDNLMPYALVDHLHEREVGRHLGTDVEFMPHVAPHFRGITLTANMHLQEPVSAEAVEAAYRVRYEDEPLIRVTTDAPWVSRIAGRHGVEIGGFTVSADGHRLVVVATLDNLLKGAATQALQNLNLAFGYPEVQGIPLD